jgi:DNA topoisomerase-1
MAYLISRAFVLFFTMMIHTAVMVASFHQPRIFFARTAYRLPGNAVTILFANARKSSTSVRTKERPYRLLIVESPSKCNTIAKILSKYVEDKGLPFDYQVLSCMGHIRDLSQKKVNDDQGDFPYPVAGVDLRNAAYLPSYVLIPGKEKIVSQLRSAASSAERVLLATDPDREGEAMAWHLTQVLDPNVQMERVTFTEITPTAISAAVEKPTNVNPHLVRAQETRRILDRLAGFTVSPVLWKKIAPGLSAGRVQSVGMALTVQRERERLMFQSVDYASISGVFIDESQNQINAKLVSIGETPVANSAKDLENESRIHLHIDNASNWVHEWMDASEWAVKTVESRPRQTSPPEPYKTSTLQQDAVRRLGLSVQQTMRAAQRLYEQGLISYMRTDSAHLSDDVESVIRETVINEFGIDQHVSRSDKAAKKKKKDSKFAQEAHEAIRPAIQPDGRFIAPDLLDLSLSEVERSLYQVIYRRTLACRMPPLITNQTTAIIEGIMEDGLIVNFRASGSVVLDPGFTRAYGRVDDNNDDDDGQLPPIQRGQKIQAHNLTAVNHQTQPPPRYTEASFVKELEALGVGRPSTYASTIQILRDRAYVGSPASSSSPPRNSRKVVSGPAISAVRAAGGDEFTGGGARGPMVPSLTAFIVCTLLEKHCPSYVDPDFTARMEERLDQIASGEIDSEEDRKQYLNEFYAGDNGLAAQVKRIDETVTADDARRARLPNLLVDNGEQGTEDVGLFVGPWGPYVQLASQNGSDKPSSASLPAGMAADLSTITPSVLKALLSARQGGGLLLGNHPDNGKPIYLKTGRFGAYLQLGDDEDSSTHSLPRQKAIMRDLDDLNPDAEDMDLSQMLGLTFEEAVGYVSLPRTVCTLEDLPITASIGPYGPYLKYNNSFVSLDPKDGDVLSVDTDVAIRVVTDGIINGKSKSSRGVIAELGEKDGHVVAVKKGRYGNYLNWKKVNAKLPAEYAGNPSGIPLDLAWDLIKEKDGTSAGGKSSKVSKTKGIVLPTAPKRPLSAYLHFCAAKRREVTETTAKLGEISKKLAKLWAELGDSDREIYLELAATAKEEYIQARARWEQDCQKILNESKGSQPTRRMTMSLTKINEGPKRPLSAYLHFCAAKRPEVATEGRKLGDISKELARLWAVTPDRSEYEKLAEEDKKRYDREMQQHSQGNRSGTGERTALQQEVHSKSATAEEFANNKIATVRSPSAYMLFCKEVRPQMIDEKTGEKLPFGEASKRIATMWKECDADVRQRFEKMAAEEKERMLVVNG